MSEKSTKRLSSAARREQLLDNALAIVREEGSDALTLAHVAERSGVTKPIAYGHFNTRTGLLVALYKRMDEVPRATLIDALKRAPAKLADVARIASRAYMSCHNSAGPEWYAVSAALEGAGEMDSPRAELLATYAGIYRDALAPFTDLSKRTLHLRCVAIIGAAEGIAQEMHRKRTSEAAAADTLASLIIAWLGEKN
ncbi:MAG: TetR/AcrR family transcriptional regulator [Kofleriaceae bacterium]